MSLFGHVVIVVFLVGSGMPGHRNVPGVLVAVADVGLIQIHVRRRALGRLHVGLAGVHRRDLHLRDRVLRRRVLHVGGQIVVIVVVHSRLLLSEN